MNQIYKIENLYKEYTSACANLVKCISDFFFERDFGVTVSITDETYIEIIYSIHLEEFNKMKHYINSFNLAAEEMCQEFNLEPIESRYERKRDFNFDPEIDTFLSQKILLKGVKNEKK